MEMLMYTYGVLPRSRCKGGEKPAEWSETERTPGKHRLLLGGALPRPPP